jgi:hypothetical protein
MKLYLWKLFLRIARSVTLTVDDWIQRQEVALRDQLAVPVFQAEVDPVRSAVREKAIKKSGGVSAGKSNTGISASPHSRVLVPHRLPRLKYHHGEFVEVR